MDDNPKMCRPEMGLFRSLFWPMYQDEVPKVLTLFFVLLLIILNYSILRICKDTLMINSSVLGAETLPFIKCSVTPFAVLFTAFYIYVSPRFNRLLVFNISIIGFSCYFLFFLYWLFPHLQEVNFTQSALYLESILPKNLYAVISLYRNWAISLFYILAELWSGVVMSYLFWEFVNNVTKLEDAKRFYGFFCFSGHLAYLIAGGLITWFMRGVTDFSDKAHLENLLFNVGNTICVSSCLIVILFTLFYRYYNNNEELSSSTGEVPKRLAKKKKQVSILEGISFVVKSPYLRCIALMILCYGISIDLVEVVWKSQIKKAFPNPLQCFQFMAQVQIYTSIASTIYIVACAPLLRYLGWGAAALMTPLVMTVTSVIFFILSFAHQMSFDPLLFVGASPLVVIAWIGLIQVTLTKGSKNTLFMVTKEMAYIPLSPEEKQQGKATIEVLCERFGRSGGAIMSMFLIFIFGNISEIIPFSAVLTFITCAVWLWATWTLKVKIQEAELEQKALSELKEADLSLQESKVIGNQNEHVSESVA